MPNFQSGQISPSSATRLDVTGSSQIAVAKNTDRQGVIIVNLGPTVYLGLGITATLKAGITLGPLGAFNMGEYDFTTAAITVIGTAGEIAIQEFTT